MRSVRRQIVRDLATLALSLVALVWAASSVAQQPLYDVPSDPHARDLLILTEWFEGEFDNEEQLWFEADPRSMTPEAERHTRVHTVHRRMALPDFGEHVFYVEEYQNNDPAEIIRQRLVVFSSDGIDGGIRMQQGFFHKPEQALGAHRDASQIAGLEAGDVFFLDGCDVRWRRVAGQFEGSMAEKACVFGEGPLRRYSIHNLVLSQDKYWRVDATRLVADDSLHAGYDENRPTEMRRADPFVCEVTLRLEDGSAQRVQDLALHSQGGVQAIVREDTGEELLLRLRDKEYPYYDTRPDFLFLSIRKAGERRSLAYTVTDADARRLGVSFGGTLAHCYREGYTFRQPLELL
ncbi:MAG: chromophore lyase CpcT/CpeT [Pseudomonadota bacterium]